MPATRDINLNLPLVIEVRYLGKTSTCVAKLKREGPLLIAVTPLPAREKLPSHSRKITLDEGRLELLPEQEGVPASYRHQGTYLVE